jgi:hypothetical protein
MHGPNYTQLPPDLLEGEEEYEVETMISHQMKGYGLQYLIK